MAGGGAASAAEVAGAGSMGSLCALYLASDGHQPHSTARRDPVDDTRVQSALYDLAAQCAKLQVQLTQGSEGRQQGAAHSALHVHVPGVHADVLEVGND